MAGISDRLGSALAQAIERKRERDIKGAPLPNHVAIIMDGNRRFAWTRALPTSIGHRKGKEKLEEVMDWVLDLGIEYLTVYALSTENMRSRTPSELDELYDLYVEGLNDISGDDRIHNNEVRFQVVGARELLPPRVVAAITSAEERTEHYNRHHFTVCIAYGSREEIIDAIRMIAADHKAGQLDLQHITEEEVSKRLYTSGIPDPDLVIRTSGEERVSNFLLWQLAYSELYFTDVFWPSFGYQDFLRAIQDYQLRKRRYGR